MLYMNIYTCSIVVAAATVQKERSRRLCTAILNQVIRELAVAFKPSDMKLFSSFAKHNGGEEEPLGRFEKSL